MGWVEKFLRFHKGRNQGTWKHPSEMGTKEVEEYLTWLAVELLGHKSVETTMIYTHVMAKPGLGVRSPLDV